MAFPSTVRYKITTASSYRPQYRRFKIKDVNGAYIAPLNISDSISYNYAGLDYANNTNALQNGYISGLGDYEFDIAADAAYMGFDQSTYSLQVVVSYSVDDGLTWVEFHNEANFIGTSRGEFSDPGVIVIPSPADLNLKGTVTGNANLNLRDDTLPDVPIVGQGIATLDDVVGEGEARFRAIGNADATLDALTGDSSARLDGVTGDGLSVRRFFGNIDEALDALSGEGTSFVRQIALVPPEVCFVAKQATSLNAEPLYGVSSQATRLDSTMCGSWRNGLPLVIETCSTWDNATSTDSEVCITGDEATHTNAILCIDNFAALPVSVEICASWGESLLVSNEMCSGQTQATPINVVTCSSSRDVSDVEYLSTVTVYPEGESTLPSSIYKLRQYATDFELRTTRNQFVQSGNTFKMRNDVAQGSVYTLAEYTSGTFYRVHPTLPADEVTYPAERMVNRQWIVGPNDPYDLVESVSRSPLSNAVCSNQDPATVLNNSMCDSVDEATHLFRNTCNPYEDLSEIPDPVLPPVDPPLTGETITIPTQEVYVMQDIIVSETSNNVPIDLANVSLAFDVDSHAWTWSAILLDPSQENLLKPASNGTEVRIHITINGEQWILLAERTRTTRKFNEDTIRVSGRGLSALLDAPYQAQSSVSHTSVLTNQQIAESFLPSGWTITWDFPVWNVPANTYAHQNITPLVALKNLVKDCGAILVPSRTTQSFTVRPRYPVTPWNFANVNPDVVMPDNVIIGLSEEPVAAYGANGVFVHGLEGGKQALCRLQGTAGERLAPTVSNAFMVDSTSIRARGEAALAAAYVQPKVRSVDTFMDGGTIVPLIDIGTFIEFNISGAVDRGIVNSVSISSDIDDKGVVTVVQSLVVGENTENTFSMFTKLLPVDPLQIVKIISSSGDNSLVETVAGNQLTVRGTGTANARFYLRSGRLDGPAPLLTVLSDIVL